MGASPSAREPIDAVMTTTLSPVPDDRAALDEDHPLVRMRGITKRFPGVLALHNVDLELRGGEIHTLAGENGSGKSTLMRILAGVLSADAGSIRLDGDDVPHGGVANALAHGITLISQELALVPGLSVAENVFLGHRHARRFARIDWRETRNATRAILNRLGVDLDPDRPVATLPIDLQQIVGIARALSFETRVLLMDEPTSALDPTEVGLLFRVMRQLRDEGVAIVFVSHRLHEMLDISDCFTVLRDGAVVARATRRSIDEAWLVANMVGRELTSLFPARSPARSAPVLCVRDLHDRGNRVRGVTFDLAGGEITGLAGLVGAGRTELVETLSGLRPRARGRVTVGNAEVSHGPGAALAAGIALVPDDRRAKGSVGTMTVTENLLLAERGSGLALRRRRAERAEAEHWCARLSVRCRDVDHPITELSGGNQQKVVLARCLSREPAVLLLDEPTRGIDIGGKAEIYQLVVDLAARGVAILMVSSELVEILGLCDRVLVMHAGELVADLRNDLTEERIISAATGAPT